MGKTEITITCDTGHELEALRKTAEVFENEMKKDPFRILAIGGDEFGGHYDGAMFNYYATSEYQQA